MLLLYNPLMHRLLLFIRWPQSALGLNVLGRARSVLPCKNLKPEDIIISRTLVQAEGAGSLNFLPALFEYV